MPSPSFSAEEAVAAQLDALHQNNVPWPNHGVQTAYEFAFDVGGLDPSLFFGFPKDLYHFDHFLGLFLNKYPELVDLESYQIEGVADGAPDCEAVVAAFVAGANGRSARVRFHLRRKVVGPRKGALATWMLTKEAGA